MMRGDVYHWCFLYALQLQLKSLKAALSGIFRSTICQMTMSDRDVAHSDRPTGNSAKF